MIYFYTLVCVLCTVQLVCIINAHSLSRLLAEDFSCVAHSRLLNTSMSSYVMFWFAVKYYGIIEYDNTVLPCIPVHYQRFLCNVTELEDESVVRFE